MAGLVALLTAGLLLLARLLKLGFLADFLSRTVLIGFLTGVGFRVEPSRMAAPGLLVYWFGSDLFYANIDRFAAQVRKLVTESSSRVRWLAVDAGAITSVDYTAGCTLKELDKDLARNGVALVFATSARA